MIGAAGWQHPRWSEEYYPEGLPPEWQLGYYGNEYSVVLIPASVWEQAEVPVAEWLAETDTSPQFLAEWPDDMAARERARESMQMLGKRGLGLVIPLAGMPGDADLGIYKELLARDALIFDFAKLTSQEGETCMRRLSEVLGEENFAICWHGDSESQANLALGPIALTRISAVNDAKDLRRIIETILQHSNRDRKMILIVDGDPPDMQLIQNAGIILDLL